MRTSLPFASLLPLMILLFVTAPGLAQTTVSTGPSYVNEVYYSLEHGVVRTEPLKAWDIAFQVDGFSSAILTNGGAGVLLYSVPGKTAESWSQAVDTSGMATAWPLWYNSTDTWNNGAFNMGIDYTAGDFGWGVYSMATHVVTGTSLYVIALPDKSTRKIMIESLSGGVYNFRYANLDGSGEVVASIAKSEFSGKDFAYYSISDGKSLDHEPAIADWDLLFGKYEARVSGMQYPVTGVRANPEVSIARIVGADPATVAAPDTSAYSTSMTAIGHDWKTFSGASYSVDDSLAFFVNRGGAIYRIVFSSFGGSANGNFVFNQERLATASSVDDRNERTIVAGLYPSVASSGSTIEVVYALEHGAAGARALLHDVTGRTIFATDLDGSAGLHRTPFTVPGASGLYFLTIQSGAQRVSQCLIVR